MVSFEGPDQYSQAGGLGVRAKELCRALAGLGFRTTLVFVGDPDLPGEEVVDGVQLVRWAQHLSARTRRGVYEGEDAKVADLEASLPLAVRDRVLPRSIADGRTLVVLAEEWQTAGFCVRLDAVLRAARARDRAVVLWNANNHFGFERIDFPALAQASTLTTVSRYMKHLMWRWGANPLVIPNGIPEPALAPVDGAGVAAIRDAAATPCLAVKIGRFSPDKRWIQAVEAIAHLRAAGLPARMLTRGGIEPHGAEVLARAAALGLDVAGWTARVAGPEGIAAALSAATAPRVDRRSVLPDAVIPVMYAAATGVLANSGHEPFGLVGLEAMASGGVAFVGATGEDYARPFANCMVVETDDPGEVAAGLVSMVDRPELAARIRGEARRDAAEYTWPRVIDGLLERLRWVAQSQASASAAEPSTVPEPTADQPPAGAQRKPAARRRAAAQSKGAAPRRRA
jgi:glycosyltransferase involved in cell wall biosynthesis